MTGDKADTHTLPLSRPIEVGGTELTALHLRVPDAEALEGVDIAFGPDGVTFSLGMMSRLVANAADIPLESARKIRRKDIATRMDVLSDFFAFQIEQQGEGAGEDGRYRIALTRPIQAHGEELTELVLEDPENGVVDDVKVTLGPRGQTFDIGALNELISSAAGIPLSSARKISVRDIMRHLLDLLDFFGVVTPQTGGT